MLQKKEDKNKRKENRFCLRSARLSVVDYEVAISQCARAWFIVDLFSEISEVSIGSRLARERRWEGKKEERGCGSCDREIDSREIRPIRRAVNQLSLSLPSNVAILRIDLLFIHVFVLHFRSPVSACPPRLFHQRTYVNGIVLGQAPTSRDTKAMSSD